MEYGNYIEDYDGVKTVDSVESLLTAEFNAQSPVNAFVLPNKPNNNSSSCDYDSLAVKIGLQERHNSWCFYEFDHYSFDKLIDELTKPSCEIKLTSAEEHAASQIFDDLDRIFHLNPTIAWIGPEAYSSNGAIHATVKQWHHDANIDDINNVSKILKSYNIAATRFLRNCDAKHLGGHIYSQIEGTTENQFQCGDFIKFLASSPINSKNCHIHTTPDITDNKTPRLLLSAFTETFKLAPA